MGVTYPKYEAPERYAAKVIWKFPGDPYGCEITAEHRGPAFTVWAFFDIYSRAATIPMGSVGFKRLITDPVPLKSHKEFTLVKFPKLASTIDPNAIPGYWSAHVGITSAEPPATGEIPDEIMLIDTKDYNVYRVAGPGGAWRELEVEPA